MTLFDMIGSAWNASDGAWWLYTAAYGAGVLTGAIGLAMCLTASACEGECCEGDERFDDESAKHPMADEAGCDSASICAWCYPEQPHMKARGICPHHKREMVEQAREYA